MSQTVHPIQQLIASYTGRLLREHFGKGPESVLVSMGGYYVTIYLRKFLTPSERILLEQDLPVMVYQLRNRLMETAVPAIAAYIESVTGIRPEEVYYDWALQQQSGMITVVCPKLLEDSPEVRDNYSGKAHLEEQMSLMNSEIQRMQASLYSCEMNNRTLLFVLEGALVPVERELMRLGHGCLLKEVKRSLVKSWLHEHMQLEEVMNRRILDVFVDWNASLDKTVVVMVTSPR